MQGKFVAIPLVLLFGLAACTTDLERGVAGAAGGALIADALDEDVATGAAIGATAGVFCDNAGICRR